MATLGNSRHLHKSKMAARTRLEINCWANYLRMMYKTSVKGFRYAEFISDIIFLISGQGYIKIHLENGTLELFS